MSTIIHYRIAGEEVHIVRCLGNDGWLQIPEKIEDLPVTRLAPYAFSPYKRKEEQDVQIWEQKSGIDIFGGKEELLCGDQLTTLELPRMMKAADNYVFYGSRGLKTLKLSDRLHYFGSGAFMGCGLDEVKVDFYEGESSGLKDIVNEMQQEICAELCYHREDGRVEKAVLYFPPYYEEEVENGPARIFETRYHGTGYKYRQCFHDRVIDYKRYDELFWRACVEEEEQLAMKIAFGRLMFPCHLLEQNREVYIRYLKDKPEETAGFLVEQEREEEVEFLTAENLWTREMLEAAVALASRERKAGLLSRFMNEKNRLFPVKKKSFDL